MSYNEKKLNGNVNNEIRSENGGVNDQQEAESILESLNESLALIQNRLDEEYDLTRTKGLFDGKNVTNLWDHINTDALMMHSEKSLELAKRLTKMMVMETSASVSGFDAVGEELLKVMQDLNGSRQNMYKECIGFGETFKRHNLIFREKHQTMEQVLSRFFFEKAKVLEKVDNWRGLINEKDALILRILKREEVTVSQLNNEIARLKQNLSAQQNAFSKNIQKAQRDRLGYTQLEELHQETMKRLSTEKKQWAEKTWEQYLRARGRKFHELMTGVQKKRKFVRKIPMWTQTEAAMFPAGTIDAGIIDAGTAVIPPEQSPQTPLSKVETLDRSTNTIFVLAKKDIDLNKLVKTETRDQILQTISFIHSASTQTEEMESEDDKVDSKDVGVSALLHYDKNIGLQDFSELLRKRDEQRSKEVKKLNHKNQKLSQNNLEITKQMTEYQSQVHQQSDEIAKLQKEIQHLKQLQNTTLHQAIQSPKSPRVKPLKRHISDAAQKKLPKLRKERSKDTDKQSNNNFQENEIDQLKMMIAQIKEEMKNVDLDAKEKKKRYNVLLKDKKRILSEQKKFGVEFRTTQMYREKLHEVKKSLNRESSTIRDLEDHHEVLKTKLLSLQSELAKKHENLLNSSPLYSKNHKAVPVKLNLNSNQNIGWDSRSGKKKKMPKLNSLFVDFEKKTLDNDFLKVTKFLY